MHAIAHESRLNTSSNPKDVHAPTHRQVWEQLAAKDDARAIAALEAPAFPEWIGYLGVWSKALFGRSGVGMDGLAPLTHTTLAHWQQNTGIVATPAEIDALLVLDAVRRDPSLAKDTPAPTSTVKRVAGSQWPTRKAPVPT